MKRWIALLLILALLAPNALALASERTMTGRLVKYAFTSDDNIYREYTLDADSVAIEMQPYEYLLYTPIHWIDSNYLSYVIESVESSDSTVVAVSTHRPGRSRPITQNEVGVIGDYENIGVGMFALKPGKVTVTVKYATYLSRQGLNYNDKRGTPHQTKVFEVTVGSPLKLEAKVVSGSGEVARHLKISMEKMYDAMDYDVMKLSQIGDASLLLADNAGTVINDGLRNWSLNKAGEELNKIANKSNYGIVNKVQDALDASKSFLNGLSNFTALVGSALSLADEVEKQGKWQLLGMPMTAPRPLKLEITLTNTGDAPVNYNTVWVACSDDISVYHSIVRAFGRNCAAAEPGTLAAGESITFTRPVSPALSYGDVTDPYPGRHAYDAWINVGCEYTIEGIESYIEDRVELSAFSYITEEDVAKLREDVAKNPEYYLKYFGYRSMEQMLRVKCPVEVVILDEAGNELTVLRNGEENLYWQDDMAAFAQGDEKYVLLPAQRLADRKVRIRALEDGTMNVSALEYSQTTNFKGYEEVPIKAGDEFEIRLAQSRAGELFKVEADGALSPVEHTAVFDAQWLNEALQGTDVSPWAYDAAVNMLQKIPMPQTIDHFSQAMTRSQWAQLLVNYYEHESKMTPDSLTASFAEQFTEGESQAIAAADSLGLMPGIADPYAQNSAAQPVNVGEAIGSLIVLLDENGALTLAQLEQIQGISPETLLSLLRDWGFMRSEGLVDLKAEDALTVEAALAMLWEAELVQGLKALGQILQKSAYQQSNNALREAVYSGKEGDPLIGILANSDHGLSLNSVLMYTESVDVQEVLEQDVEGRANGIVAQLQTMNKKWSKYTKEKMPADLKALKQKKGLKPLKVYPDSASMTLNEDGSILLSGLVWFDDNGRMFEDAAYVYTGLIFKDQETGKTAIQEALLADQTFVTTYMELYRLDLQWFANKALNVEYPELSKDMKGDEVKALQEKLKALGYYSGKADGKYSKKVVTAVKKFQKACGLKETGVADSLTQQKIYTWDDVNVMLLDWLNSK